MRKIASQVFFWINCRVPSLFTTSMMYLLYHAWQVASEPFNLAPPSHVDYMLEACLSCLSLSFCGKFKLLYKIILQNQF